LSGPPESTLRERCSCLAAQLRDHDVDVVGIEGSGGYGRPVALHLQRQGMAVVEVPPQMTAAAAAGSDRTPRPTRSMRC
jgi:transposase